MPEYILDKTRDDILKLRPHNWQQLADITKYIRISSAQYVTAAAAELVDGACEPFRNKTREQELVLLFLTHDGYRDMGNYAAAIHYGASAAFREGKSGDFTTEFERSMRITDAFAAGTLIDNFVSAARQLVMTRVLAPPKPITGNTADLQDEASTQLYDGSRKIMDEMGPDIDVLRPSAQTIADIVYEEIGILPPDIRTSIITTMNFKAIL